MVDMRVWTPVDCNLIGQWTLTARRLSSGSGCLMRFHLRHTAGFDWNDGTQVTESLGRLLEGLATKSTNNPDGQELLSPLPGAGGLRAEQT